MPPLVTVVSGTYNRLTLLQAMIASARVAMPRSIPMDFVIVDGGSGDGTLDWLATQPDITVIAHGELLGAIKAFTDGALAATGKYVVLANDDVTFHPDSIMKALVHLEETPTCGAVAFADNRLNVHQFAVQSAYAKKRGRPVQVPYAQVGMFRKWLGDHLNWWRGYNPAFAEARTYGGDNMLSSSIWELGYSVDPVEGALAEDHLADDNLRAINNRDGSDSDAYMAAWPDGPMLKDHPQVKNMDKTQLRILYMPIFDPSKHALHTQTKTGLRDALSEKAVVYEVDYHRYATRDLQALLTQPGGVLDTFKPHMMLMQCHGLGIITPDLLRAIRNHAPGMVIYNWNGDVWPSGLTSPDALSLMPYIDLQMTVNQKAVEDYARLGVNAAYWQIGYEEPGEELPDVPAHDIVFLANAYDKTRLAFGKWLKATWDNVGIYGSGWDALADGECLYDFAMGKALYRKAKIAIGTNEYPDQTGFVSNRIFQVLAANGAVLLQQEVKGLEDVTGIKDGEHYYSWKDKDDLTALINQILESLEHYSLSSDLTVAIDGYQFVSQHHSFQARVIELFRDLIPLAKRRPTAIAAVRYTGRRDTPFGEIGQMTGFKYSVNPAEALYIDPRDLDGMLNTGYFERLQVHEEMGI